LAAGIRRHTVGYAGAAPGVHCDKGVLKPVGGGEQSPLIFRKRFVTRIKGKIKGRGPGG